MATQPTQNPVPSESPRDLKFNAGKIDEFVTSASSTYRDRFGGDHYTIEGIRQLAFAAISQSGFVTMDSFEDGNTISAPNQVLRWKSNGVYYRWDGEFPKVVPSGSTPSSSGEEGKGAWLAIADPKRQAITLEEFGADATGTESAVDKIQLALDYALATGKKVEQHSGTFLLDGPNSIVIKTDIDVTGTVFKPSATWGGQIVITQPDGMVTYDKTSDVVAAVNSSSQLSRVAGSNILDGLVSDKTLDGCYVQIATSQPMFIFRDTTYTRIDLNRVYNRGNMENPLKYGIGTNVQSIKALKIRSTPQTIKGITIDESLTKRYRIIYANAATRLNLINTSFINRPVTQSFSDTRIEIQDCYDLEINGLYTPSVADSFNASGDMYSYTIALGSSMNVRHRNLSANGEGWGATGSNNCANILYEDCDLSRVDFHMPFQGHLKINRCNIGRWGVLVTGIGDLFVTNSNFNASIDWISNVISTRPDAGGWFDGDLYMDNITLTGRRAAGTMGVALISGLITSGQGVATGSPITSTLFNKVILRDIKLREGSIENTFATLISVSGADNALLFPKVVDVDGIDFGTLGKSSGVGLNIDWARFKAFYPDMTNSESSVTGRFTCDILLRNIKCPLISFTSGTTGSFRHNPRVVIENARHIIAGDGDVTFTTNQRGNYELNSCSIDRIRFFSGNNPNGMVYFKMNGGRLTQPVSSTLPIDAAQDTHIAILSRVAISCQFSAQDSNFLISRNLSRYAVMQDCEFWDYPSGNRIFNLPLLNPTATTSLTTTIPVRVGQDFIIATGYTTTNTYTKTAMKACDGTQTKSVSSIGAGNVITTYTISGNLVTQMLITSPVSNEIVGLMLR